MNKTELVNAIAEKANLTKVDAKNALDAALEAIAGALENDDKVTLIGFGTFSISEKGARTGINPRTKETINIPARKVVKFKPGAEIASKVNE
jgi:DNA-binding protein HU-beta